jgi:chemotaxis protein methyltransferase CheR
MTHIDAAVVERFRAAVLRRLGLFFEENKNAFLEEVLRRQAEKAGGSLAGYLLNLESEISHAALGALAKELTVTETYFFRNHEQFRAFTDVVIPARMAVRADARSLRILSAGCASGEEPYSIAMAAAALNEPSWSVDVRAVDVNPLALEKARKARYSPWAFREMPPALQHKWFVKEGRDHSLVETLRRAVRFEHRNLMAEDADLWPAGHYDAIFCRNVMMYFSVEGQRALVGRIARSLAPGGFLFLGHAETLRGLSDEFHLLHSHGAFYYSLKSDPSAVAVAPDEMRPSSAEDEPPAGDAWLEAIQAASLRVEALARRHAGATAAQAMAPDQNVAKVLSLLQRERFSDALAVFREMPAARAQNTELMLLEAVLLVHNGKNACAEDACRRLLVADETSAEAHYVLALCREAAGDSTGAIAQNRLAAYLDPSFAMPRLHVGLLARRSGDQNLARRELTQAQSLLQHEDASRLMLFGGGFNRQAMLDLCGSALRDCEHAS